jgi:hypothetical protein
MLAVRLGSRQLGQSRCGKARRPARPMLPSHQNRFVAAQSITAYSNTRSRGPLMWHNRPKRSICFPCCAPEATACPASEPQTRRKTSVAPPTFFNISEAAEAGWQDDIVFYPPIPYFGYQGGSRSPGLSPPVSDEGRAPTPDPPIPYFGYKGGPRYPRTRHRSATTVWGY